GKCILPVALWNAATGKMLRSFTGHTREIVSAWLEPDAQVVAACSVDGILVRWSARDGTRLASLKQPSAFSSWTGSADGNLTAYCFVNGTVSLWDRQQEKASFKAHRDRVTAMSLHADGKQV